MFTIDQLHALGVRPSSQRDVSLVKHLMKRYSNEVGFLPGQAINNFVANGWAFTCDENGDGAGALLVRPHLAEAPHVRAVIVTAVQPDAQRQKHALHLVERICCDAAAAGQALVQAWCREDIAANAFWRAAGFAVVARRTAATWDGVGHLLYRRALRPGDGRLGEVYIGTRERGPGGRFVTADGRVPPFDYELSRPWLLKRSRPASASRRPPLAA